jgi:hypothetical protein
MLIRKYIYSVICILLTTSLLKFGSALSNIGYLNLSDSIFSFLNMRELLIATALLEFLLAIYLIWNRNSLMSLTCIAFFSSLVVLYRIGLFWLNPAQPCPCLGRLTDWIHVSPQIANNVMKGILAYLLFSSYIMLFCSWKQQRRIAATAR